MRESVKAVLLLLLIFSALAALFAWTDDRPDTTTWWLRIGSTAICLVSLCVLFWMQLRRNVFPDYLLDIAGEYFNRGDLCFAFDISTVEGAARLTMFYQNHRDAACRGQVALRPARGFFLGRADMETIVFQVECEPAALGFVSTSLPIPQQLQGKKQSFEVGASVRYPEGKGKLVLFRDGILLRNDSNFDNPVGTSLTVAGLAAGMIVFSSPAAAKLMLPIGVSETIDIGQDQERGTLWRPGDPDLAADQVAS